MDNITTRRHEGLLPDDRDQKMTSASILVPYITIYKWSEMGNFIIIETTLSAINRLGMPSGFAYSRTNALDLQIKKLEAQRTEINLKINWMIEVVKRGIV